MSNMANNSILNYANVVREIYQGILQRPVDEEGFRANVAALQNGVPLSEILYGIINSREFRNKNRILPNRDLLPNLMEMYPEKYLRKTEEVYFFKAYSDDDFNFMESLIVKHGFYDSSDVYSPEIDLDKHVTASIIRGLGAKSCIEMGCFTGPVLSLLEEQGVDVCGVDVSHLAFVLSYKNIRNKLRFGDLRDLNFDRTYDLFCGMDVFEHINPLSLEPYILRIAKLVGNHGFVFMNSPMFGNDDVFGTVFDVSFPEWEKEGRNSFWHHIPCDKKGWPQHGHLVFASPNWWEGLFIRYGLVRERHIERVIQSILGPFFEKCAPARRSLFILKHADFNPDIKSINRNLESMLSPVVASMR